MGAEFQTYKVKANNTKELEKQVARLIKECRYDHGHSGYTGTIAESNGEVSVINEIMSEENAEKYIEKNAKKWEDNIAVPIDDQGTYLIGGWYSC